MSIYNALIIYLSFYFNGLCAVKESVLAVWLAVIMHQLWLYFRWSRFVTVAEFIPGGC